MIALPARSLAVAVTLALVAACAPTRPPAPVASAPSALPGQYGVILAERPVPATGAGDVRGQILARLGDAVVLPAAAGLPREEFIVRTDDGRTLSVVQDNPQRLRPGERILVGGTEATRLVRPQSATAGPTE